jgi:carbamate kinase
VGLLALQAAAYTDAEPSTLDVLGAQTQGMIAYVLEQELRNYFPPTERFATVLTMVEVDKDDPAFAHPTKFVGPIYPEGRAQKLAEEKGWPFRKDGESWRRVVPSPLPQHIFELEAIRALLDLDIVVICTGGGGIPTLVTETDGKPFLSGVEAVIDKDLATELLAREVGADLYVMATDVDGVYTDWGTPDQRRIDRITPEELRGIQFPAGSMGPKVEAAARFVEATGGRAAIGGLGEIEQIVNGTAGTQVVAP